MFVVNDHDAPRDISVRFVDHSRLGRDDAATYQVLAAVDDDQGLGRHTGAELGATGLTLRASRRGPRRSSRSTRLPEGRSGIATASLRPT